jgi:plasmid stabilization system protein ParE
MGWTVTYAPQALEALEQLVRFIAEDDPQAAIRFGDYLVDRAESLRTCRSLEHLIANGRMSAGSCASRITSTIVSNGRIR